MMFKLIGQLVFATLLVEFLPVNAGFYEWQAGVESPAAYEGFSAVEMGQLLSVLPEADLRQIERYPTKVDQDSYGVVTSAQSAIIVDSASDMILFAKHPDQVRSIGSVTKLMAALVFLAEEPDLSQMVSLDPEKDLIEGGRIYLAFYDQLSLQDVLGASLVGSDNTATESLMRFVDLDEETFVEKMNQQARILGMEHTTFKDPTGIDAGNVSTARDLVLLLRAANQTPLIRQYMQTEVLQITQASGRVIAIENTNQLLGSYLNQGRYEVTGGKTGFLPQAGYVLVTSVQEDDHEIYVVVLGSSSKDTRVDDAKGLSAWAFKVFSWPR